MRRKDRQIPTELLENVIERCDVIRIAFAENNIPYIVPMNYGYEATDGKYTFYMHCANEGRKLEILKHNPIVCFEMDCSHELVLDDDPMKCTMRYESIIGMGAIDVLSSFEDKTHALNVLMDKYTSKSDYKFPSKTMNAVTILRLSATELTGKSNPARYQKD